MERQITVVKRAEVKKANESYNVVPGDIICVVKGSTGNVYVTTLRRNKQHTCTCKGNALGHYECYHIKNLKALENARYAAEKVYVMSDALHAKLSSIAFVEQVINYEKRQILESVPAQQQSPEVSGPKVRKQGDKLVKTPVLNSAPQSTQMPAWLAILPSRQKKPAA